MTVSITDIGENSFQLNYEVGDTLQAVFDEISAKIATMGWTQIDKWDSGIGYNDNYVFKAPCVNEEADKIIRFRFDQPNTRIYMENYESWDSATHTGTNLTYRSNEYAAQPFDTAIGGSMIISANPKWFAWYCSIPNRAGDYNGGGWTFIFEREASKGELANLSAYNYPKSIWSSNWHMRGGDGGYRFWGCPKLYYSGAFRTGGGASDWSWWSNGIRMINHNSNTNYGYFKYDDMSGDFFMSDITVGYWCNPITIYGRVYGLKWISEYYGANLDTITLKVDSNYMLDLVNGTDKEFFITTYGTIETRLAIPK